MVQWRDQGRGMGQWPILLLATRWGQEFIDPSHVSISIINHITIIPVCSLVTKQGSLSEFVKVSQSSDELWWADTSRWGWSLSPMSGSGLWLVSLAGAGLWLAVITPHPWHGALVSVNGHQHYHEAFSCHSLSKHEAACFTNQIIINISSRCKYLFSISLPLSFPHKLTVYKLSCQNNFSDVQEIKNWEIYFQIAVWVIAEAMARPSVIRAIREREWPNILLTWLRVTVNWIGQETRQQKRGPTRSARFTIDDDKSTQLNEDMKHLEWWALVVWRWV